MVSENERNVSLPIVSAKYLRFKDMNLPGIFCINRPLPFKYLKSKVPSLFLSDGKGKPYSRDTIDNAYLTNSTEVDGPQPNRGDQLLNYRA
jgi:hypothetical protein